MDEVSIAIAVIEDARKRLLTGFPDQVRACLDALTDEQVWWRPNPGSNSIGNLILHLCGSSRHFLGRGVGGTDYRRDRPAEFSEKGPLPREALQRAIDDTVADTEDALKRLEPGRLMEVTDRAGDPQTVLALIGRTTHHWAVHTGQIVYATKALKEGAIHELWMKTMR